MATFSCGSYRLAVKVFLVPKQAPALDADTLRRLAVQASCDPRTIAAVAAGRAVRGLAGQRARKALTDAGLLPSNGK